jgi:hypothetical protein
MKGSRGSGQFSSTGGDPESAPRCQFIPMMLDHVIFYFYFKYIFNELHEHKVKPLTKGPRREARRGNKMGTEARR